MNETWSNKYHKYPYYGLEGGTIGTLNCSQKKQLLAWYLEQGQYLCNVL